MTLSRRDLLKLGAGATLSFVVGCGPGEGDAAGGEASGAASSGPGASGASGAGTPGSRPSLNTRTIPSSGQEVPAVGLGARNYRTEWAEGGDLSEYRRALDTFVRGGGRVIDTSPNYGDSESVLGRLFGELGIRDDVFLATKVDREGRREGIERMRGSMERLGTDRFELMQVHNLRGVEIQLETMKAWKEEGTLRYIGVTTSSERQYDALEDVMRRHDLDFVQVDYAMDNRSADEVILPLAADRGMAVLVNLPFGRGRLFEATAGMELPGWAAEIEADTWAQVFLKYVNSHPDAQTIPIPGTTQPDHARDNLGAARGPVPSPELRREMEAFADRL